jgi:hypothetical protein
LEPALRLLRLPAKALLLPSDHLGLSGEETELVGQLTQALLKPCRQRLDQAILPSPAAKQDEKHSHKQERQNRQRAEQPGSWYHEREIASMFDIVMKGR